MLHRTKNTFKTSSIRALIGCVLAITMPLVASLSEASPMSGGLTVHVPADYPTPQAALDAVPPGSVVIISGGTWLPISITKSVTLIGENGASIKTPTPIGHVPSEIVLAGPGSGQVALQGLITGDQYNSTSTSQVEPSITGGGFDALYILDSAIHASSFGGFGGGFATGAPGISTTVPFIWIERSSVVASATIIDGFISAMPDAANGIESPGTVVSLNSIIVGADNGQGATVTSCPATCVGYGGFAVQCQNLYAEDATFIAGKGASYVLDHSNSLCCQVPYRPAISTMRYSLLPQGLWLSCTFSGSLMG